jgi:hypothetical protein
VGGAWLERSTNHLQARLASLRLEPARHPYPEDRRLRLVERGVRASISDPWSRPRKRALFALWFLAAGVLPRAWSVRAIELGYLAPRRPAWLTRLLRRDAPPVPQGSA